MAIALKKRRIVVAKNEATRGTAEVVSASADGVPMIRDATFEIKPIEVERPTLRLSLTDYPDIYPGKATVTIRVLAEMCGRDSGFPAASPILTRMLRACGYKFWGTSANVFAYKVSALTTNNGPLRHGEALAGTALNDSDNVCIGDAFSHDGGILTTVYVSEGSTAIGDAAGTITSARGSSETVFTINARSTAKCHAFSPLSDVNTQETATVGIFLDGKAVSGLGMMGNVEFQFNHGDAVLAQFEMQGVLSSYVDVAMPTDGNEGHKVPPTFLGSRLTLAQPINAPADTERYGTGGTSGFTNKGALSQVRMSSGNNVVLPTNSIDANGISYALITSRKPAGSFNPTEVTNAEFHFITRFVAGTPARLKIGVGATSHTDPSTQDGNTFEFLAPGLVFSGMADTDRDGINVFDASFEMTGGDYDSTATGESPGQDNEFVIVHR